MTDLSTSTILAPTPPTTESDTPSSKSITKSDLALPSLPVTILNYRSSSPTALPSLPPLISPAPLRTTPPLSQRKKWSLLALFSIGVIVDSWGYAAFFVFTSPIAQDLSIRFEQQTWVINSYAVTFSAFLLAWGRVADVYAAKPVSSYTFITLGILSLVNSFVPEKISFFVIRALSGIAGAALIPAAYRLIVLVFEPHELKKAFATYGLAAASANASGLLISGVFQSIPGTGQMAGWRWFLRLLAALMLPLAIGSLYWIPSPPPRSTPVPDKWKRLDLVGSTSMFLSILLLILGLTLGASDGWATPQFLVPFLLSFTFLAFFFYWEKRVPADYAILPPSVWSIPNYTIFNILGLYPYCWWSVIFISLIEYFVRINGDSAIIAAVRMLPISIAATALTILFVIYPDLLVRPRWPMTIGMVGSIVAYVLLILSNGGAGIDYWKFIMPGCALGSASVMIVLLTINVGIMTSVPPEMAGVAGAVLQVALQVGSVVGISIQAGLFTVQDGGLGNWANVRAGYIFVLGLGTMWLVAFWVCYKPGKGTIQVDDTEKGGEEVGRVER